ncbi:Wzz/FepE/Etk N-terminal domain-containing protein [Terrilactibacillus sp. S3-3]|nr:Wzz/FepE/Etk N-terminal domain-containing protein [Terrilactibacillus sp. S3-3]
MEDMISLKDLVSPLRKRVKMIALVSILLAILGACLAHFAVAPKYAVSAQMVVKPIDGDNSRSPLDVAQTNSQIVNTYMAIAKSPVVLQKVIDDLDLPMTSDQLKQAITVANEGGSQVFTITVIQKSPQQAARIANHLTSAVEAQAGSSLGTNHAQVLSKAKADPQSQAVSPSTKVLIILSCVISVIVSIGLAYALELFETKIKDEKEIEQLTGLPVIGKVYDWSGIVGSSASAEETRRHHGGERVET